MIELGDGIEGLKALQKGTADLILSDLPSGATRHDFDNPPDLAKFWPAVWSALKPSGVVCLFASNIGFASKVITSEQKYFRYDLIWHKSVATGFLNARSRPLRAHEYILLFWRKNGAYNPQMTTGATGIHEARRKSHGANYDPQTQSTESRKGATDRHPVSVLEFGSMGTSSKGRTHPQQKPEGLLRYLIASYSYPGDLVVDPYAGSGSSGAAADSEQRRFRGWDINPRFGLDGKRIAE